MKVVKAKFLGQVVWWGWASAFTDLTDVPAVYTGQGGKVVSVKSDVSWLEFTVPTSTYTLPVATASVLWWVKKWDRISIDANGVISADVQSWWWDTLAPAANTADYIPQWNGVNSKTLKDWLAVPAGWLAGLTALWDKVDKVAGSRLITTAEWTIIWNTSNTNTGDNTIATAILAQYIDWNSVSGGASIANKPTIPTVGTWWALAYPIWTSWTPFVKMTAAGTFALDTTAYVSGTPRTSVGYYIWDWSAFATAAQWWLASSALQSLAWAVLTSNLTVTTGSSISGSNTWDNATNSQYSWLATSKQDVLTGLTSTPTELNILDWATLSTTELNYVDGVTSAIQTQLWGKQETLVSTTNIKSINGVTILGAGDLTVGWDSSDKLPLAGWTLTWWLVLVAGTTTVQPLKMVAGTNLTTAVSGCFEYNWTDLFFTIA